MAEDREPGRDQAPGRKASRGGFAAVLLAVLLGMLAFVLSQLPAPPPPTGVRLAGVAPMSPWRAPDPNAVLERVAFGSCLHQARAQPIWQSVIAQRPDLFLMLGDNVYGDAKSASLAELSAAYAQQALQPELATLRSRVPVLATWDDHDYGRNDAGGEFPWKEGARALFAEFWQVPAGALPAGGIYRAMMLGPPGRRVQVILLDTRSFRSALTSRSALEIAADRAKGRYVPSTATSQEMLGAAQWAWLEAELGKPADIRLVVSSIQVLAEAHGWERWGNLPAERTRLLELIRKTGARGIVLLSGDRHRAAIYRQPEGSSYRLVEVTSSSLNMPFEGADAEEPARLGPMFTGANFGQIAIDWEGRKLGATLHAGDGREVARIELSFAELGY